jgi:hypothetical protein
VSASPWAQVAIDGRPERCRDTPCSLELPAGTYRMRLHNPVKNVGKVVDIQVVAGQTLTLREVLVDVAPAPPTSP